MSAAPSLGRPAPTPANGRPAPLTRNDLLTRTRAAGMHRTAKDLLLLIAHVCDYGANAEGCRMHTYTLADRIDLSESQTGKWLSWLVKHGWLEADRVNGKLTSRYRKFHLGPRCWVAGTVGALPRPRGSNSLVREEVTPSSASECAPLGAESREKTTTTDPREPSSSSVSIPIPEPCRDRPWPSIHSTPEADELPPGDGETEARADGPTLPSADVVDEMHASIVKTMDPDRFLTEKQRAELRQRTGCDAFGLAPSRAEVARWLALYGDLVLVAWAMVERMRLATARGIERYLENQHAAGRDAFAAWVDSRLGGTFKSPSTPLPAAATQAVAEAESPPVDSGLAKLTADELDGKIATTERELERLREELAKAERLQERRDAAAAAAGRPGGERRFEVVTANANVMCVTDTLADLKKEAARRNMLINLCD